MFTVELAALAPDAILTTRAPVFTAFAMLTLVAVAAVARLVFPDAFRVVELTTFGAVLPNAGGEANSAALDPLAVDGETYALVDVPASASA